MSTDERVGAGDGEPGAGESRLLGTVAIVVFPNVG